MREPGHIENDVLVGHDGQLFLAGGQHQVLEVASGRLRASPASLDNFWRNIEARRAWADAHGAAYLHVIFPDKHSICPECWPFGAPAQIARDYMGSIDFYGTDVLYPAKLLHRERHAVLVKVDTHLNDYGYLLVAGEIARRLGGFSIEAATADLLASEVEETVEGDLGSKLTPPLAGTRRTFRLRPSGLFLSNNVGAGNAGIIDLRFNPAATTRKRCVIFGDSFGRALARLLQFCLAEVHFFRSEFFQPEIAALIRPDFVITEHVERYMNEVRLDESRGFLLMSPYLNSAPYAPSREFAAALSAVLSYPRQPYVDFCAALQTRPGAGSPAGRHPATAWRPGTS